MSDDLQRPSPEARRMGYDPGSCVAGLGGHRAWGVGFRGVLSEERTSPTAWVWSLVRKLFDRMGLVGWIDTRKGEGEGLLPAVADGRGVGRTAALRRQRDERPAAARRRIFGWVRVAEPHGLRALAAAGGRAHGSAPSTRCCGTWSGGAGRLRAVRRRSPRYGPSTRRFPHRFRA